MTLDILNEELEILESIYPDELISKGEFLHTRCLALVKLL